MKLRSVLILITLTMFTLHGESTLADRPVAIIQFHSTEVIPQSKFEQYLNILKGSNEDFEFSFEDKANILDVMINQTLVRQDADNLGIAVSEEQVLQAAMQQLSMELAQAGVIPQGAMLNDVAQFNEVIESQGVNPALYLENTLNNIIIQQYIMQTRRQDFIDLPMPEEREVRNYYNSNISLFATPAYIEFQQIYFSKTEGQDVNQIRNSTQQLMREIEVGSQDFDDLLLQEGELFPNTGDLGSSIFVAQGDPTAIQIFGDDFMFTVFENKDNNNPILIESNLGLHILKVVSSGDAGIRSLEETISPMEEQTVGEFVAQLIYVEMQKMLYAQLQQEIIIDLRERAGEEGIRVFEEAIR